MTGLYTDDAIDRLRADLERRLPDWGLSSEARLRLLTVSENATFRADDPARPDPIVLRVHRPGYHTRAEIASELDWIEAVRAAGIVDTPAPLRTVDGARIAACGEGQDRRDVVGFAFMAGQEPEASRDLAPGFRQLGQITAKLHRHARTWHRPAGFVRKTWTFDTMLGAGALWGDWRAGIGLTRAGQEVLERCAQSLQARLSGYGTAPDRFGLIHADLRLANLLIDARGRVGVIDFDDCGFGWFFYDFAAAISFHEREPFVPDLMAAWLDGYRGVAPVRAEDAAMLPTLVMLRRMLLTAWLASHSETPTAQALGSGYTDGTVALAEHYLSGRFLTG